MATLASKVKERIGVEEYRWLCTQIQAQRLAGFGFSMIADAIADGRKQAGATDLDLSAGELRSIEREMKKLMGANYESFAANSLDLVVSRFPTPDR